MSVIVPLSALLILAGVLIAASLNRRRVETHKRGVRVLEKQCRRRGSGRGLRVVLAGVDIPPLDETKHFKIIGSTGTGKSTAIGELLGGALARGDRAIVADPDGSYTNRFHERFRGDALLNPFDARSYAWDIFGELEHESDIEQLARALIPECEDASGREWRSYARTYVAAVLRGCWSRGRGATLTELWRLLAVASTDELRIIVAGSPAQPFLDADNARMFGSIRSVTTAAMSALEQLRGHRGRPFSVRHWVRHGGGSLFIPYRAGEIAALRAVIATWLRVAIFEAMNQQAERDQRLWFVVDELDALGAIDGLKDALARLRKFGGRCVLGFQSAAQVTGTYGGEANTIIENCGNTLILRCSSGESGGTSQFVSRLIGEREVVRRQVTRGRDRESPWASRGSRRSTNIAESNAIEPAVLPSEIEQLPDLQGYFKGASTPHWRRVAIKHIPQSRRKR